MRAALAVVVAWASGCDIVYDLTRPPPDAPPPDAPPDLDKDDDGRLDDDDNCPDVFNPGQENGDSDPTGDACERCPGIDDSHHDEDGDDVDDACDNCPHLTNVDQTNTDLDDLGDACDPGPRIDCIVRFDPFVEMPAATYMSGTWRVDSDRLEQTESERVVSVLTLPTSTALARMWTRIRVIKLSTTFPPNVGRGVGIYAQMTGGGTMPDTPAGMLTAIVVTPSLMSTELQTLQIDNNSTIVLNRPEALSPTVQLADGDAVDLVFEMKTSTTFFANADLGPSNARFDDSVAAPRPAGPIGFRVARMAVAYDYVLVSQQRPALPCP